MTAPMIAPMNCAPMYAETDSGSTGTVEAEAGVAELRGAVGDEAERDRRVDVRARGVGDDDTGEDREAPAEVTMRNPPLKPFVFARATLATTPQPRSTSIAVPTSSERNNTPRLSTLTIHPFRLAPRASPRGGTMPTILTA